MKSILFLFIVTFSTLSFAQNRHQIYSDNKKVELILELKYHQNTQQTKEYFYLYYKNYDNWSSIWFHSKEGIEHSLKHAKNLLEMDISDGDKKVIRTGPGGDNVLTRIGNNLDVQRNGGSNKVRLTQNSKLGTQTIVFLSSKDVYGMIKNLRDY